MNLYELTGTYKSVLEMLSDDDVPEEEVAEALSFIDGEIEEKAENYGKVIRNLEAEQAELDAKAKNFKDEYDRLKARSKALGEKAAQMKQRLYDAMKQTGKTKIKGSLFSFSVAKNPQTVEITDWFAAIQAGYVKQLKETDVDKATLKEDLKNGEVLEFAHLVQTEGLRMR